MAPLPEDHRWTTLRDALRVFATATEGTQGQRHIQPLHWYVSSRLVVEGGFNPDEIVPRPPFVARRSGGQTSLIHDPAAARPGERTVYGGLKTKDVDVVVSKEGIGPVIAVSLKGTLNAYRNLTNRMEEAAGDCTNLHIAYPALVYAFWNVLRGTRPGPMESPPPRFLRPDADGHVRREDVAFDSAGRLVNSIARYQFALEGLAGRKGVRSEPSLYEAVGMTIVDVVGDRLGHPHPEHPPPTSVLNYQSMFREIYHHYDLRFVYQAPALARVTRRNVWDAASPAFSDLPDLDYTPRCADDESESDSDGL